jgi:hypothetical protein
MRIVAFLAFLTVSAMVLAGCSGDGDGDSKSSSSSSSRSSSRTNSTTSVSSSSSTSASSTSTGPANSAPTGSISVSVNGTNATFNLTGSDPDGDTLVWDLAFGDGNATNGTVLPANVTHQYASNLTGNVTVDFTLTDGQESTTYNVTFVVGGAGAGATGQHVEGGWSAGDPVDCGVASLDDTNGTTHQRFDIEGATAGGTYTITFSAAVPGFWSFTFFDSAGNDLGPDTLMPPAPIPMGSDTDAGTIPDDAATADASSCGGAMVTFTYDGLPP